MSQRAPERRSASPGRWEPRRELEQMTERMRRMIDETFDGVGWQPLPGERGGWSPPVDIEETDDAYVVEAEVPSVKREDVNVEFVGNDLEITGEVKERERNGTLRRRTRRVGRFAYHVTFPTHVDTDKIDADLADGVLTVRIPKSQRDERRRIEIKG
jgi:HSP20 family protein